MFDKINRGYLFPKLLNSNISTKFVNVVKYMYSTVTACVRKIGDLFSIDELK